jgi:hypothetical protein
MGVTTAFSLAAFIAGLFCTRLKFALIGGAALTLGYAALVLIGLWHLLGDADLPYLLGMLTAWCLTIFVPAILGYGLRRGAGWLLRRRQTQA